MCDLAPLRDPIQTSARCQTSDLDIFFRHLNFESLSDCVIARPTSPCAADAVARACRFLGLRSTHACATVAADLCEFTRRYSRRLLESLHIDVKPSAFGPLRREMGKVFSLARSLALPGSTPSPRLSTEPATRPASIAHGERMGRYSAPRPTQRELASKRSAITPSFGPKSPKVAVPPSNTSSFMGLSRPSPRIESPRESDAIPPPAFEFPPLSPPHTVCGTGTPAGEHYPAAVESADSHVSSLVETARRKTFDVDPEGDVWKLAQTLSEPYGTMLSLRKSGLSQERIVVLTIEAITQQ